MIISIALLLLYSVFLNKIEEITAHEVLHVFSIDSTLPTPFMYHALSTVHDVAGKKRARRVLRTSSLLAPLYPGYGTHYVYVYIGSPPQRQSLILDTGGSFTAFPCFGCTNCGEHTDKFFNVSDSNTASIPKCLRNQNCQVSQRYHEGSTWHGYKVIDRVWVGDSEIEAIPDASSYQIDFTFACQTSVTGLFKSQLADGLLGLADVEETLPNQLWRRNITQSKIFAICFREGGGIFTLGGVDQSIHSKRILYSKLDKLTDGGYGVFIQQLQVRDSKERSNHTINAPPTIYSGTKGAILDSGSTDTYLPAAIAASFQQAFRKVSGLSFTTESFQLAEADINKFPDIVFSLVGSSGEGEIEVVMPVANYLDSLGDDKYSFRIHFTDTVGSILGANFITGHNVIFDPENSRIGFAKSSCNYEELIPKLTSVPTLRPSREGSIGCDSKLFTPYTACNALCSKNESSYNAAGSQEYINDCKDKFESRKCQETCSYQVISRGPIPCLDKPWSECTHGCIKSRFVVPKNEEGSGECNYKYQTATCYSGLCPPQIGDYLVYLDMRVRIEPAKWSYVYSEYFYTALSAILKAPQHNIELLHNLVNQYATSSKLHFQIRIKAKDHKDLLSLRNTAEKIVSKCRSIEFPQIFLATLTEISALVDGNRTSRFGWLLPSDVEIFSAVALPISDIRDPYGLLNEPNNYSDGYTPTINTFGYFVLGIAIASILILVVLLYMHFRLRQEYALLSKDKSSITKSSETLRKLWSKFANFASNHTTKGRSFDLTKIQGEKDQQLTQVSLLQQCEDSDDGN